MTDMEFMAHVKQFKQTDRFSESELLINEALGLGGETGEVLDLIKKARFHRLDGKLDLGELEKELGDVLWYFFALVDSVGLDIASIKAANRHKLVARHGGQRFVPME